VKISISKPSPDFYRFKYGSFTSEHSWMTRFY